MQSIPFINLVVIAGGTEQCSKCLPSRPTELCFIPSLESLESRHLALQYFHQSFRIAPILFFTLTMPMIIIIKVFFGSLMSIDIIMSKSKVLQLKSNRSVVLADYGHRCVAPTHYDSQIAKIQMGSRKHLGAHRNLRITSLQSSQ